MYNNIRQKEKKGIQLSQAFGAVLTVVLIGILVIIAIFLFVSLGDSLDNTATSGSNQTVTTVSEIGQVINSSDCDLNGVTNFVATNESSGTVILASNFTISSTGILTSTSGDFNGTNWNVTYTGLEGGEACTANKSMIAQFATYPVLIGLVGTIIFLGLVIGVLVASFVFTGRKGV